MGRNRVSSVIVTTFQVIVNGIVAPSPLSSDSAKPRSAEHMRALWPASKSFFACTARALAEHHRSLLAFCDTPHGTLLTPIGFCFL